ncbi:caffeoylshikimate esterase isoform X2 [Beta vulgaris subsp. vulgaris]|uniref:caffeoylshikimate esterase isoform X2 n=1 Tax=Beta vulgaris subsp. vulgaris TaxID=3555 RepID=UPI002036830B|nr:caffeoylshikimate esterase isoform X2 [Beta vulgaris subsp. vulgaris]
MKSSLSLTLLQSPSPFFNHTSKLSQYHSFPVIKCHQQSSAQKSSLTNLKAIMAKTRRKKGLEDLSDELYEIASLNLDHAPARRRVRSAFIQFHRQLDHLAPPGIRTEEWYELNSKGQEIFCKSWLPKEGDQIKGVVCFCHGYGDTCTFLFEGIARRIAGSGYGVYAVDHPGFGLSDGLHGYISNFDDLVDNVIEQYAKIKGRPELQGLPRFIFGQSMGGAVALKTHLKEPDQWDGMILVAPMCKVAEEVMPPAAVLKVANVLSNVIPEVKFFPTKDLAELAFRNYKYREMAYYNMICYSDRVRLKTAMEILKVTSEIESNVNKVCSPLLVIHGAADMVTDPNVSKFLYEKACSKDKTIKLYQGGYHSILEGEPDDAIFTVFDDIIEWLDTRCSS